MNSFGRLFRLTTFGESHGPALGAVVEGCPAGVPLDEARIQKALDRRRPGQSALTTARAEADCVEVLSGLYEGKTLGTPIAALVRNTNQRSADYAAFGEKDRPGHADAVWRARFKHQDRRGGGRTSGRETLSRVIGGAIAEAFLARQHPQLHTVAWVSQVGPLKAPPPETLPSRERVDAHPTRCPFADCAEEMATLIQTAKQSFDSLGGSVDICTQGMPVGFGEPVFGKLKARLADALAGIGAVTGVVWGGEDMLGDIGLSGRRFHGYGGNTRGEGQGGGEVYGGIQGGLSNGKALSLRVYFKPPATLGEMAKAGRHDPCILPRAVPVVEAMVSLVLADLSLQTLAFPHAL
ncbi:MAG: chorismate synthase [Cystobacterineae bacterium]|nr:chorismate synthase [Cystobacterineae bacterium]